MERSKLLATDQWSRLESRQDPRPTKSAFQWEAVVVHTDEMCDSKDKGQVVPCPTECQDMKKNMGSECTNSLSGRLILGENCPDSLS